MCYNCGCNNPFDDMGSPDNLTADKINSLAKEMGQTIPETKQLICDFASHKKTDPKIAEVFQKAAASWKQSVSEAEKNATDLLHREGFQ